MRWLLRVVAGWLAEEVLALALALALLLVGSLMCCGAAVWLCGDSCAAEGSSWAGGKTASCCMLLCRWC